MAGQEKLTGVKLYLLMLIMLISGATNTIFLKTQDVVETNGQEFNHPFLQTSIIFVGELLCLGVYHAKLYWLSRQKKTDHGIPMSPGTQIAT